MGTFRSEQDNQKYLVSDVWYFSTLDEHFDPAPFPDFPKKPGQIEESRLEEESEADPLVVLVVFLLLVDWWGHPRVRHLQPNVGEDSVRDGEGGVDPAVGVHHVLGDVRVHYTVDRVSNILPAGDQEAAGDQDHHGGLANKNIIISISSSRSAHLIVKTEDVVVDADFIYLEKIFNWFKDIKHFHEVL